MKVSEVLEFFRGEIGSGYVFGRGVFRIGCKVEVIISIRGVFFCVLAWFRDGALIKFWREGSKSLR